MTRFTESIELIRALWAGDDVTFEGELYAEQHVKLGVRPVQQPAPPIWLGSFHRMPCGGRLASATAGWVPAARAPRRSVRRCRCCARRSARRAATSATFPISKRVFLSVHDERRRGQGRGGALVRRGVRQSGPDRPGRRVRDARRGRRAARGSRRRRRDAPPAEPGDTLRASSSRCWPGSPAWPERDRGRNPAIWTGSVPRRELGGRALRPGRRRRRRASRSWPSPSRPGSACR